MENKKVKSFTDLVTWKEGHKLVLSIYELTEKFPKNAFSLQDQMRRCSVSITSCVAEGFSRKYRKEKVQFYYMSLGSTTELQNQLLIARDLKFLSKEEFDSIANNTIQVHKLLNGLIKSAEDLKILNT